VLTGRKVDAAEAYRLGVVDRLVPAGDARTTALALAEQIAAASPVGVRNAKRALRLGADEDLHAGLEIEDEAWRATAFSADRREGIAAFAQKRAPRWPGR
jgi:enoyl-CoA hydratase/carnithine racemase